MDTLTQITLGATVAEVGFRHRLGGKAVVLGAACGLLPDLDMLAALAGELAGLVHHRGLSHSLLVLAAVSPLVGYAGYRWSGRREGLLPWAHLAFWALLTHPLLDLFTVYGTQLLAPFSNARLALDAVSIVDLVYAVPIWVVAVWSLLRARGEPSRRLRWAAIGVLALTTGYLFVAFGLSRATVGRAERQLRAQGFAAVQVRALPTYLVPGAWRVVARNERGDLRLGLASSWAGRRITFHRYDRPSDPRVAAALRSEGGRMFRWFTGDLLRVELAAGEGGRSVTLVDARFGLTSDLRAAVFRVRIELDAAGQVRGTRRLPRDLKLDPLRELTTWWSVLTTGHPPRARRAPTAPKTLY